MLEIQISEYVVVVPHVKLDSLSQNVHNQFQGAVNDESADAISDKAECRQRILQGLDKDPLHWAWLFQECLELR